MNGLRPQDLSPERALIFRITHIGNLPWLAENGLHCQNADHSDPRFVVIGKSEIIEKRASWPVPVGPGGTLADYVPFYFTPWSPMLMNILTGRNVPKRRPEEIVFIVSSLPTLEEAGIRFVITDRHAKVKTAMYADGRDLLDDMVPWKSLRSRDFHIDPEYPEAFERYQAEALVHRHLPTSAILGFACYTDVIKTELDRTLTDHGVELPTAVRRNWYFQ